jgi:hypothetical protein
MKFNSHRNCCHKFKPISMTDARAAAVHLLSRQLPGDLAIGQGHRNGRMSAMT